MEETERNEILSSQYVGATKFRAKSRLWNDMCVEEDEKSKKEND
jgi:hypothetical protein